MATLPPSIVTWQRLVPISRSADFATAVAAQLHDPLWMLSRQHRIGELTAQDAGSPAFVRVGYKPAPLTNLMLTSGTGQTTPLPVDPSKPIEAQMLPEPQAPDLATRVELGLTFMQILGEAFPATQTGPSPVVTAFAGAKSLALAPPDDANTPFDPIDQATATFASMTGAAIDGVTAYGFALGPTIPGDITLTSDQTKTVNNVYKGFVTWVQATFGQIDTAVDGTDPQGWNANLLDYDIQMQFGDTNVVTLNVEPNENGAVDWTSFDFVSQSVPTGDPFGGITAQIARVAPMTVRFPGMPAPRHWDFESGELPWPDVDATRIELLRLLMIDFAMLYGVDWFILPLDLPVANAVKIDSLLVFDVFGGLTVVDPVEAARNVQPPAVPDRFTMYGTASPGGKVAGFMVLPPAAGTALQQGTVLEEVRFARDEMADMVWGIEAVTESRIGERRRGTERDAAVDAAGPAPSARTNAAPLSYQLESKVPVQWIPFLAPDTGALSTTFAEGETERDVAQQPGGQLVPTPVPPAGKILKPTGLFKGFGGPGYNVFQEQIPRSGAKVQRVQFAARALDGQSYFWIARRRRAGAGETQSGLRFDAPLPTQPPTP
jgi:hypothetical protein